MLKGLRLDAHGRLRDFAVCARSTTCAAGHFHCHLIVHMRVGIQIVFNVAEERQPSPPASYFAAQSHDVLCDVPPARQAR